LLKSLRAEHGWILAPLALALWSISRVWNVLPSILGDEYVYASQAKHLPLAEQFYSNFLFSLVMGYTNYCGTEFYTCAKTINAFFFLGTVLLTFLIAIRFLSFRWSIFAASVTALSPIAVPVSYFMPETMYFSMMTLTIWLTLVISKGTSWLFWIVSGLSLGATALVKPHAVFLLPAFVVFAFIFAFKKFDSSWLQGLKAGAATATGFLVAKFGIGFASAGTEGLKLFGGYGSPVEALTGAASAEGVSVGAGGVAQSGIQVLISVASTHLVTHLSAMLLLAGIPLILSLGVTYSVTKTKEPIGEVSSFFVLVALISVSMIVVVALFEAYMTAIGDDHSNRLILRYYEFLIPQFIVMGLLLPRFTESKSLIRIIQGSIVVAASMFFTMYFPPTFEKQYADTSTLPGIGDSQVFFIFVGLFVSCGVIFWIVNPNRGNEVIGRFIMPVVLVLALVMSQNKLVETNGTAAYFDRAGWDTRSYLQDVPGEKIMVIGQYRTDVFVVKFWIDEPNIKHLLPPEGSVVISENVYESDYVVILGNISVDFPNEVVMEGEGYRLLRVLRY